MVLGVTNGQLEVIVFDWKCLIYLLIKKMSSLSFCMSSYISFKESSYILDIIYQLGQNPLCTTRASVSIAL